MNDSRTYSNNLLVNKTEEEIRKDAQDHDREVGNDGGDKNEKYKLFADTSSHRALKLRNLSVSQKGEVSALSGKGGKGISPIGGGGTISNQDYTNFVYSQLEQDKIRRLQEMRRMAVYAEVSDCLDEICDEAFVKDPESDELIECTVIGDQNPEIKSTIEREFISFAENFDLDNRGWEYIRQLLIEGELFFENIISKDKPWHGILGVVNIPCELVSPTFYNVQNGDIREFQLRVIKPLDKSQYQARNSYQSAAQTVANMQIQNEERVPLGLSQVTYIHSNVWNDSKQFRLPYLEMARRAYKQLSLVEDAIVIYRLVRAPERLVFKVDVGNMAPHDAEAYMRRQMNAYETKKSIDDDGRIQNSHDPQSMQDNYWFAKRSGTEGSDVTTLPGGANLGQLEDLNYFLDKLYKALKVPSSRRSPDTPTRDGTEITREELRFAKFVMRIQRQIAQGIKIAFITHLKLLGKGQKGNPNSWWDEFEIQESDLQVEMAAPTNFAAMREQQMFELLQANFNNMAANEMVSTTYAMRKYLKMSDEDIRINHSLLRYDAALTWELQQIVTLGPDFRAELKKQAGELEGGGEFGGGGGGGGGLGGGLGGGGLGGDSGLPEFGDMDVPGEDEGSDVGADDSTALPDAGE